MLDETFYIDGVDARTAGIYLQRPIEFSEAILEIESESIPGRNGDLVFETGSYENRVGSAACFCLQKDVEKAINSAGRFLMGKTGYRRLETSDDPDHYWMARVENSPRIAMRLRTLAPFDITFDCKPQRFLKIGESEVIPTESSDGRKEIFNEYGQTALPLVKVLGSGAGTLVVGDAEIRIKELDGQLFLDSETMNAYNNYGNQNSKISADRFPVLKGGTNFVYFDGGIQSVIFVPRWWEL